MFASPLYYQKPNTGRASSVFLKHANTGTLAVIMFVALALVSTPRGKESDTKGSIPTKATKTHVIIDNSSFAPKTFTVPLGATVTWTNHDAVSHVVASADHKFKKSPVLKPGQNFSETFTVTGSYAYFCSLHPNMVGKIIVN